MLRRALAAALIVLVPLALDLAGALSPIEHGLSALRMHLVPRAPTGEVVLVDIDPKSINAIGTWPWSRHIHAELIDRLVALGAAEIAFDVDFSTRSNPADDAALSAALDRAGGSVILATFMQRLTGDAAKGVTYNRPLRDFADKAWTASVNVRPDRDGVVRSATDGIMVDGDAIPSIPVVLSNGNGTVGNDFLVDFSIEASAIDRISAIDVLRGTVTRSRIAGKKVIVGSEAIELHDFFNTPAGVISGSLLEAIATETLLQGRALDSTGGLAIVAGMIVIALGVFAIGRVRWYLILAAPGGVAVGLEAVATILQASLPLATDTAPWLVACFVLAVTVTFFRDRSSPDRAEHLARARYQCGNRCWLGWLTTTSLVSLSSAMMEPSERPAGPPPISWAWMEIWWAVAPRRPCRRNSAARSKALLRQPRAAIRGRTRANDSAAF